MGVEQQTTSNKASKKENGKSNGGKKREQARLRKPFHLIVWALFVVDQVPQESASFALVPASVPPAAPVLSSLQLLAWLPRPLAETYDLGAHDGGLWW